MNTDNPNPTPLSDNNQEQNTEPNSDSGQPLADLVDALQSVDTTTPEASLNATSIEDNNGDRIELNEDPSDPSVIKKQHLEPYGHCSNRSRIIRKRI